MSVVYYYINSTQSLPLQMMEPFQKDHSQVVICAYPSLPRSAQLHGVWQPSLSLLHVISPHTALFPAQQLQGEVKGSFWKKHMHTYTTTLKSLIQNISTSDSLEHSKL